MHQGPSKIPQYSILSRFYLVKALLLKKKVKGETIKTRGTSIYSSVKQGSLKYQSILAFVSAARNNDIWV